MDIPFKDPNAFKDMTSTALIDFWSGIAIYISWIFYPFRIFLFISRFNSSKNMVAHLNSIARTSPGICIYISIVTIVIVCIAFCSMMILSPYMPEMSNFISAILFTTTSSLFENQQYQELIQVDKSSFFWLFGVAVERCKTLILIFFIALAVYLFSKSVEFENVMVITTPN